MGRAISVAAIIAFLIYYHPDEKIVLFSIILVSLIILSSFDNREKSDNHDTNELQTITVSYLGGIPTFTSTSPEGVELYINNTVGQVKVFSQKNKITEVIPYEKIKSVTCETKESLTATRMLLFGIFAFALKSKKNYFKVTYINDINEEANVIFESNNSSAIVQKMTSARYNYIKAKQSLESNINQI